MSCWINQELLFIRSTLTLLNLPTRHNKVQQRQLARMSAHRTEFGLLKHLPPGTYSFQLFYCLSWTLFFVTLHVSFQADTCFLHCVVLLGTMPSITWCLGTMPGIASTSHVCTSITHFAQIGITCISGSENMHIEMYNTSFVRNGNKKIVDVALPSQLTVFVKHWFWFYSHVVYCLVYPLVHV